VKVSVHSELERIPDRSYVNFVVVRYLIETAKFIQHRSQQSGEEREREREREIRVRVEEIWVEFLFPSILERKIKAIFTAILK
jgi:hypothetical protein